MVEELLNPIGEVATTKISLSLRLPDLNGKVLGLLDNSMGDSTAFLESIARRLSKDYALTVQRASIPLGARPADVAEELSKSSDFAIVALGCSGVRTLITTKAAVELEKRGKPTVMICTKGIDSMCQAEARSMGLESLPLLSVSLPEEARFSNEDIERVADGLMRGILFALTQPSEKVAQEFARNDLVAEAERVVTRPRNEFGLDMVEATSVEEANDLFYERGWTDGLPIIPPRRSAVEAMLTYSDRSRDDVVASLPPRMGRATLEKIAVNAVMAGCAPQYLPVVVAAVEAMAEPEFNLPALQATTNPIAPLMVVNGPIIEELTINCGFNVFGQGWRSNATIGRAIRLILMNIGGGLPGTTDKAVQGLPAKYTFCVAENEKESPWEPLHVEMGFPREVSTVTVAGVQGQHNFIILDRTADSTLSYAAAMMASPGANSVYFGGGWPILALNPQCASVLAKNGYSKADVKTYLFEHAVLPMTSFTDSSRRYLDQGQVFQNDRGETVVRATGRVEDILVIVTGAGGSHSQYLATMGRFIQPVTKPLVLRDGSPIRCLHDLKDLRGG
ncbi:MAG: hypothetical protein ABIH46_12635 [Chloroflexota bacterium]